MNACQLVVRKLGRVDYLHSLAKMKAFTHTRQSHTRDEFWLLEHNPVYTQGYSCDQLPFSTTSIPTLTTDRGGQLTFHGPGQLVVYLMLDIRRRNQGVRNLVNAIESAIIALLRYYSIEGNAQPKAPGVYVNEEKIASLGIRVSRGCTYHGLSLNVDVDITPFDSIDVCGYQDLKVTTMCQLNVDCNMEEIQTRCAEELARELNYQHISYCRGFSGL